MVAFLDINENENILAQASRFQNRREAPAGTNRSTERLLCVQLDAVFPAIPYCVDLIGGPYLVTNERRFQSFRPKSARRPGHSGSES